MEQRSEVGGLSLKAYRGEGAVLLAFDVDESLVEQLAGFAVRYTDPTRGEQWIHNRLSFDETSRATPTPTNVAPIQRFRLTHAPTEQSGDLTYTATAMLFGSTGTTDLVAGPTTSVQLNLAHEAFPKFDLGFTRGSLYSEAYAARFGNISPEPPDQDQYQWLGAKALRLVYDILDEAVDDQGATLDVFAYELDESDVIRRLIKLGPRLRLFLDNSAQPQAASREKSVEKLLQESGGAQVKLGHFRRSAHSKVLILRRGGTAVKALAGSANFTVRGLSSQTNVVFVFDDPHAAGLYGQAFDQAWTDPSGFETSDIAAKWFNVSWDGLPACSLSFSPHRSGEVALVPIVDSIRRAKSSVLFSIMNLNARGGPVMREILDLPARRGLYAFGTTRELQGVPKTVTAADPNSPFIVIQGEGGAATRPINANFVVCDFNDEDPVVYTGSSNFTIGGERANGDNLVAFRDREVATAFAVKAVELIDHYQAHVAVQDRPLHLKGPREQWAVDYFDPSSSRYLERQLFARPSRFDVEGDTTAAAGKRSGRPEARATSDRWTTVDELGYDVYADALADFIKNPETPTPLAISIKGEWGTGKTSLMRMVRTRIDSRFKDGEESETPSSETRKPTNGDILAELQKSPEDRNLLDQPGAKDDEDEQDEEDGKSEKNEKDEKDEAKKQPRPDLPTIWFNAWIYQSSRQLWAGLALAIINGVASRMAPVDRERFWLTLQIRRLDGDVLRRRLYRELAQRILPKVAALLVVSIAGLAVWALHSVLGLPGIVGVVSFLAPLGAAPIYTWLAQQKFGQESLATAFADLVREPDYAAEAGFLHLFHRDMKLILDAAGVSEAAPLVIFVDDLDRCSYSTVAEVIEGLNLFLAGEFEHCIFVIGMEPTLVAAQLGVAYRDLFGTLSGEESAAARMRYGWKFLEKMVQLPLALPAPRASRLQRYVSSLTSYATDGDGAGHEDLEPPSPEEVDKKEEALKDELKSRGGGIADVADAARAMDAGDGAPAADRPVDRAVVAAARRVVSSLATEDDPTVREMYRSYADQLSGNPREFKRFLNLFRFYANLQITRELSPSPAPSLEQIGKITMLAVRWPDLVGRLTTTFGEKTAVATLESLAEKHTTADAWSAAVKKEKCLPDPDCDLLLRTDVHAFLRQKPAIAEYAEEFL